MGWGSRHRDGDDWRGAEIHQEPKAPSLAETITIFDALDRVFGTEEKLTDAAKRVLEKEPGTERAAIAAEWLRIANVMPATAVIDDLRALAERCKRWQP
jgi:hypothetical protein